MKTDKKILILAIFIGLITVVGLNFYITSLKNAQKIPIPQTKVVVAVNTIPSNVKITAEMLTIKSIPTQAVHSESFTSTDKLIGSISKVEIIKDEQVLSGRVITDVDKAALAYKIPQNMRAVSLPSSEVAGVAGFINPGDKIDILVTFDKKDINPVTTTYTQLQNIEVLAVGSNKTTSEEKTKTIPSSITVIVTPAQSEVIAYAVANGSLSYSLRNPVDTEKANLEFYNSTNYGTYKER